MNPAVSRAGAPIEGGAPTRMTDVKEQCHYSFNKTTVILGARSKQKTTKTEFVRDERELHTVQQLPEIFSRLVQTAVIAAFLFSGIASASAVIAPSGDPGRSAGNAFDYTNINITSNSATYNAGSDIRDIFGGSFSTLEAAGRTIFADSYGVTTYQITFRTLTPTALTGYSLYLAEDGASLNRSATSFQLKADGNLISNVNIVPQGQSYTSVWGGGGAIKISDSFAGVTASTFQALFTSNVGQFTGIRVFELDALGGQAFSGAANGVPEPTSIGLTLIGGLIFASLFRRRLKLFFFSRPAAWSR